MRTAVDRLRLRLHQYRRNETPLWKWRELQLEILHVAKTLRRAAEDEAAGRSELTPRPELWGMLGEAFWLEADLTRLVVLIEEVLTELANHESTAMEASH